MNVFTYKKGVVDENSLPEKNQFWVEPYDGVVQAITLLANQWRYEPYSGSSW